MKIAMLASEATPFAKTGGLADVIGTLSVALARLGHQVCVITPAYRSALRGNSALRESTIDASLPLGNGRQDAAVLEGSIGKDVEAYLIRADEYFDRDFLYGTPAGDYPDNAERFTYFCRAALEILRRRPVDVVHCHDWQAAPAAVFLRAKPARYREVAAARIVFTIHNLGFQGVFPSSIWPLLDLDPNYFTPQFLEFYGSVNFLKGGLIFADKITTVSPSYAEEILTAEQGFGLEGVLRDRAADLVGILNGIDDHDWNPWTDRFITCHYGENSLAIKRDCKTALQRAVGLPEKRAVPLIAMISRLTLQKGFDLIEDIFDRLIERDAQIVLLGSGEPRFEEFFRAAAVRYPDRVAVEIGFNEALAHRIEAGADLFLMPSLYEPCGLNQMFSQKYGTIPIVRAVGGLKDTVQDYDAASGTGTGFVFGPYDSGALLAAIDRALAAFADEQAWNALRRRAMAMDFSWERSAKVYGSLYRQLSRQREIQRGR
jgi:starch synthase